jgi:hypothetical protein
VRKFSIIAAAVAGVTAVAVIGALALGRWTGLQVPFVSDSCRVFTENHTMQLNPDQINNAATIAAVGSRLQMPPHAVTIALAVAFQESKMRNITHGDRDSIGLFQQRPSQGWGSAVELSEPRVAAARFYHALTTVEGWQNMSITNAAQAVQRSAHPAAYAKWETDARNLASALIGAEGAAVSCILRESSEVSGEVAAQSLRDNATNDFGALPVKVYNDKAQLDVLIGDGTPHWGWQLASWFVAKSHQYGVKEVYFQGQKWTSKKGKWVNNETSTSDIVTVIVAK